MNHSNASLPQVPAPPSRLTLEQLQKLRSSLESAARSVVVTHNEFSLISKLPPETLLKISEFIVNPRTRESVFEIVKMTHICQYWRTTLISYPHLWSSIFVKNDHKDFVAACLERSQEAPLTVRLDLKNPGYYDYHDCICDRNERSAERGINVRNSCRYHAAIDPLLEAGRFRRIRTLDVHLTIFNTTEYDVDEDFRIVLKGFKIFASPLPVLESLTFHVNHNFEIDGPLGLPKALFSWGVSPPTQLRHLALRECYGGPIDAVRNLTSFELIGVEGVYNPMELDQDTFLPFISGSPSLVSLSLSHFSFPDRAQLSQVTPFKLPGLKSLRLMDMSGLSDFPGLIDVPAINTLSSLRISARKRGGGFHDADFLICAENDDGFQLSYNTPHNHEAALDWLGIMHDADPHLAFVRFDGHGIDPTNEKQLEASPLPLFVNAKVLEVGASFAYRWYRDFWKDLRKVGPQLTTLRLEVIEGMKSAVATSVEKLVKARFKKGMPLEKLERMRFEGMSEEDEEKAKKLWDKFRASLDVDLYLSP